MCFNVSFFTSLDILFINICNPFVISVILLLISNSDIFLFITFNILFISFGFDVNSDILSFIIFNLSSTVSLYKSCPIKHES